MALYYTATLRGTVLSSQWAISMHYRVDATPSDSDEPLVAEALARAVAGAFAEHVLPICSDRVNFLKVVTLGYKKPAAFYEYNTAVPGSQPGDDMPAFTAFGFRQYRVNADFRSATHRVPGVREGNNSEGSFVLGDGIDGAMVIDATTFFNTPISYAFDPSPTYSFVPVLIRTQFTTVTHDPETKTVTFLDPHEISDVGGAAFYGLTSQVSRKIILGVG